MGKCFLERQQNVCLAVVVRVGHEMLVEGQRWSFSIAVSPGEAIAALSNFKCGYDGAQRQYVQHWCIPGTAAAVVHE